MEKTKNALMKHFQDYPQLQIQDIFKFLYQSSFGCEHLVASLEKATDYIIDEYNNTFCDGAKAIEALDGNYSRVPLYYIRKGLDAKTFGKIFVASAQKEENGQVELIKKLEIAKTLVSEGMLPFEEKAFDEAIENWKLQGYSPIHHSDIFRENYHPSYRVIANKFIPFFELFAEIDKRLLNGNVILAIEGGSASGKTTLSEIFESIYDCTVFHMDDFFLRQEQRTPERYAEIGGNIDRERFLEEVLQPLSQGIDVKYRKFDCSAMKLGEEITVKQKQLTVIEGAYSMHPAFEKYYDLSVFLDICPQTQKDRIIHRNPDMTTLFFEKWIPMEKRYFEGTCIKERCNVSVDIK